MDAYAIGDGNYAFGVDMSRTQAIRLHRGFGDRLELGIQLETVMITGFSKYTVFDASGFAGALYLAATAGPAGGYAARSVQAGPIISYSRGRFDVSLSIRHSSVDYKPMDPNSIHDEENGINVADDSLENYATADLMFSLRLPDSKTRLKFGITCTDYELIEPSRGVQGCVPVVGLMTSPLRK